MRAYKMKSSDVDRAVHQAAKDALVMLDSVLLLETSARLKAEHDYYYGIAEGAGTYGDSTSVNALVHVERRKDYKIMVNRPRVVGKIRHGAEAKKVKTSIFESGMQGGGGHHGRGIM